MSGDSSIISTVSTAAAGALLGWVLCAQYYKNINAISNGINKEVRNINKHNKDTNSNNTKDTNINTNDNSNDNNNNSEDSEDSYEYTDTEEEEDDADNVSTFELDPNDAYKLVCNVIYKYMCVHLGICVSACMCV